MVMADEENFDLVALGGGPAGGAVANVGSMLGAKAAVIERDKLGGT